MLPTMSAPMATKAMGSLETACSSVMTERLLRVNTSKFFWRTACGFTAQTQTDLLVDSPQRTTTASHAHLCSTVPGYPDGRRG